MCWARSGQRAHRYARAMLAGFPRLIRRLSHSLPCPSPLLFVLFFISSLQASRENHWHDDWLQILPDGTHVSSTRFPVAMFSRGMQLTTAAVRAPEAEASASPCSDDVPSGTILNRTVTNASYLSRVFPRMAAVFCSWRAV